MKQILFNGEMVRAILDGRKTVTRRVIKPKLRDDEYGFNVWYNEETKKYVVEKYDEAESDFYPTRYIEQPYQVGDTLYVREAGMIQSMKMFGKKVKMLFSADNLLIEFSVSDKEYERLSKFEYLNRFLSPYWLTKDTARIFLLVTDVRVEQLQDITEEQAEKEGCGIKLIPNGWELNPLNHFCKIWDSTLPKPSNKFKRNMNRWQDNPWVWVIEFERCERDGY